MKKLAAGNWKMNGTQSALAEVSALITTIGTPACEVLLCPPATLLSRMAERAKGSPLQVGGQDCHAAASGAHTGDISAAMLADAGASHVILGHSERRADHGESNDAVRDKVTAATAAGLTAILCVGETEAERDAGTTLVVIGSQLQHSTPQTIDATALVVAYEPIWAIGTGRTPTLAQIAEVHSFLRHQLIDRFGQAGASIPLLYGGSVKPSNAAEIFAVDHVNGALVGGASLKAVDFAAIIAALSAS